MTISLYGLASPGVTMLDQRTPTKEMLMSSPSAGGPQAPVRIQLTDRQKAQIREALGRSDVEFELEVTELEERIAPRLASNHNEARLADA